MTKPYQTIQIHPQSGREVLRLLKDGEQAIASMDLPLAFCVQCRGKSEENHPRLCKAVVKAES